MTISLPPPFSHLSYSFLSHSYLFYPSFWLPACAFPTSLSALHTCLFAPYFQSPACNLPTLLSELSTEIHLTALLPPPLSASPSCFIPPSAVSITCLPRFPLFCWHHLPTLSLPTSGLLPSSSTLPLSDSPFFLTVPSDVGVTYLRIAPYFWSPT